VEEADNLQMVKRGRLLSKNGLLKDMVICKHILRMSNCKTCPMTASIVNWLYDWQF